MLKKLEHEVDFDRLEVNTNAGVIFLEVGDIEETKKLSQRIRTAIGDLARVACSTRHTPVLLLGVPEWAEVRDVEKSIIAVKAADSTRDGKLVVSLRSDPGGKR